MVQTISQITVNLLTPDPNICFSTTPTFSPSTVLTSLILVAVIPSQNVETDFYAINRTNEPIRISGNLLSYYPAPPMYISNPHRLCGIKGTTIIPPHILFDDGVAPVTLTLKAEIYPNDINPLPAFTTTLKPGFWQEIDFNQDGKIDMKDIAEVARRFGQSSYIPYPI